MKYNWQQLDWPDFKYDDSAIQDILFAFAEKTGHVSDILKSLPDNIQTDAIIDFMVSEAIKTSEIEGEYLSRHNLGLKSDATPTADRRAKGVADLMVDVRNSYKEPLTKEKLFQWHEMLLGGQRKKIDVGM